MIKLLVSDGKLAIPNAAVTPSERQWFGNDDPLLVANYGMDHDVLPWPIPNPADAALELGPREIPASAEYHEAFTRKCAAQYWTLEKFTKALQHALYDARETGLLPAATREVMLPDGGAFEIDDARFYCPECDQEGGHVAGCITGGQS